MRISKSNRTSSRNIYLARYNFNVIEVYVFVIIATILLVFYVELARATESKHIRGTEALM